MQQCRYYQLEEKQQKRPRSLSFWHGRPVSDIPEPVTRASTINALRYTDEFDDVANEALS